MFYKDAFWALVNLGERHGYTLPPEIQEGLKECIESIRRVSICIGALGRVNYEKIYKKAAEFFEKDYNKLPVNVQIEFIEIHQAGARW